MGEYPLYLVEKLFHSGRHLSNEVVGTFCSPKTNQGKEEEKKKKKKKKIVGAQFEVLSAFLESTLTHRRSKWVNEILATWG
jgi:hypothetical protein